ncbi:MAG TPA: N-acetylmuramoyl-L-alanine amidase [Pseudonocardiaceae bacterium]|nr:N-acetylmuramoyl-L-alanine amidase [Pseudonocardiaceae bacterium]
MPVTRLLPIFAVLCSMVLAPIAVAPAAGARPAAVRPDVQTLSLAGARQVGDSREVTRRRTFSMVGVRWAGQRPATIEVQARRPDGGWRSWTAIEPMASSPDGASAPAATEPLWLGASTGVRVRSDVDEGKLEVVLIDPGTSTSDQQPVTTQAAGKPPVISRAGWGADESIRCDDPIDYVDTVKAAVIHHTAGTNDYTMAESAAIVRGIYAYHAQTLGWCDIGYNALVDKYGQIFEGAYGGLERAVRGAHTGGFNTYTFGVSMMGLYTGVAPTSAQQESVSQLVAWKLGRGYRDPRGQVTLVSGGGGTSRYPADTPVTLPVIFGHRDTNFTECPGDDGYPRLPAIRDRVAALVGDWTDTPVYRKWQALGGESGPVGSPHRIELAAAGGGLSTWFAGGWPNAAIYWSATTGAHEVHGPIAQRWADTLGAETGILGYPVTDVLPTTAGERVTFQHGYIELNTSTGELRVWATSSRRVPRLVARQVS